MKIAFDVMGGDNAPKESILAVNQFLATSKTDTELVLFGNEYEIKKYLNTEKDIEIVHTQDFIDMGQKDILNYCRHDKTSSMALGLKALKIGEVDAFLTAGPTGPFVAESQLIVKRMPGMKKVALCLGASTITGHNFLMLDVGANVDVSADHLLQYAMAGSIYAKTLFQITNPKIGLINNGSEKGKGRELERNVYDLLEDSSLNFVGNLEPIELLTNNNVDVMVGDGFTCNAIMKTAEGVLKTFGHELKRSFLKNTKTKIAALLMKKDLKDLIGEFSYDDIACAILLGIDKPVLKAHGNSKAHEMFVALQQVELVVNEKVVEKIKEEVEKHA